MISIIAATDLNGVIGYKGDMPWGRSMKSDLKRFKELTDGKTLIMGRKTFESLPGILPNRKHFVLTRDTDCVVESPFVKPFQQPDILIDYAKESDREVFVVGGAEIYKMFLPHADKVYITHIKYIFEGDTYFPSLGSDWVITGIDRYEADDNNKYDYDFIVAERRERK